jgi:hypothetical protein
VCAAASVQTTVKCPSYLHGKKKKKSFVQKEFQTSIDIVKQRLGVTTDGIAHNVGNALLQEGCNNLGHQIKTTGQVLTHPRLRTPNTSYGMFFISEHGFGW